MHNVDPAAVQSLVAQLTFAGIIAAVLFGFFRIHKRHYLQYWVWSWLASLLNLGVVVPTVFGRAAFPGDAGRMLLAAVSGSGAYLQIIWILFGNYEVATGSRLPRRITRWVPIAVVVLNLVAAAITSTADGVRARMAIRTVVGGVGFLAGALAIAYLPSSARGGLGRWLMGTALVGCGLQRLYFAFGGLLRGDSAVFRYAHSGVLDLTLQMILSLAMVVWLLEGERENAIALSAEREHAEAARAAQARLTTEIVNGAAQGIVAFDRDFKIVLWNPYVERLTGWPASTMLGMGLPELFRRARPPRCEENIERALRGEVVNDVYQIPLPGEPFVSTHYSPLHGLDGQLTGAVLLVSDVTERKKAETEQARLETALRAAASDWKSTFDAVDVLVVVLDAEGRVNRLNRAAVELAGSTYAQQVGRPLAELGRGEPWTTAAALSGRLAQAGSRIAEVARDPTTGRVWGITVTRFASPEGGEERSVIVARDITAVVRLEESLRRKEHMSAMGALVAAVAHEVRNPLFGISSTIDAFEARFGDAEKHQRYLTTLRTQVERLRQLMSDLLEYGKPLSGEARPENLAGVVAEAVRSCDLLARRHEVAVEDKTPSDLPPVSVDRRRMVQVFQNVLQNAIEHAGPGGRVWVEAQALGDQEDERIRVAIRDSGPGFQEADLPRVFEPFFTRRRGGTGLGLSIVQRIVEQNGGRVSARNHPEGGSLVSIEIRTSGAAETEVGLVRTAHP